MILDFFKKALLIFCLLFTHVSVAADTKLVVLLDWFMNPNHAPLWVAKQQGFFKEEGLDVKLISPADPSDPPKLVAAGKADIGITYEPEFRQQLKQGLPLIRIGTLIGQPLSCVLVKKSSGIHSLRDLKGKRVGYSGTHDNILLQTMLKKHDLTLNDIILVNVHYDLTKALLSGKIDAATGMMRNFEKIQMELEGVPVTAFFPEKEGVSHYSELIFIAHQKNKENPDIKKFMAAFHKGVIYLKNHPNESWRDFVKAHPELDDELNKRAWRETVNYFYPPSPTLRVPSPASAGEGEKTQAGTQTFTISKQRQPCHASMLLAGIQSRFVILTRLPLP